MLLPSLLWPILLPMLMADVIAIIVWLMLLPLMVWSCQYSMIGTLFHRAKTICSGPLQLQKEEEHLYSSLKKCKYPTWANRVKLRSQAPAPKKNKCNNKNSDLNNSRDQKPHITVPYHQGLSESFKRTCKKYGIEVHLKGGPTIKNLLMAPKDKDPILKK